MSSLEPAFRLRPLGVVGLPEVVDVPPDGLTLGRGSHNALVIDGDVYPQVSTHHVRVFLEGAQLVVEDLESKNGLSVNGRRVERLGLSPGDRIQLGGKHGPRFLVLGTQPVEATAMVSTSERAPSQIAPPGEAPLPSDQRLPAGNAIRDAAGAPAPLGSTAILRLRSALGIVEHDDRVHTIVARRMRVFGGLLVAVTLLVALGTWLVHRQFSELELRGQREAESLRGQLQRLDRFFNEQMDATATGLTARFAEWEEKRAGLEHARDQHQLRLAALEKEGEASLADLGRVRAQLDEAARKLEQYSPLNLNKVRAERRAKLVRALSAVVFIERRVQYRDEVTGRLLYIEEDQDGLVGANLEGRGEPLERVGSGSGFCISPLGFILTNDHVVARPELARFEFDDAVLRAELEVSVVFSGTTERRPAKVVTRAGVEEDSSDDLALLKIEPFEGLVALEKFAPSDREMAPGTEVQLFGFPLGKNLLQRSEVMSASVFSGIVSRNVEPFLQVHAAVYPGNSGGPVVDENGVVLGIVTAVQTIASGQIASDIGYVIPIARAALVWPPPPADAHAEEAEEDTGERAGVKERGSSPDGDPPDSRSF